MPVCSSVCSYLCMLVCLCMVVCLSVCLSACLFVCLSVYLYACLSVCMLVCLSVCLSACLPACLSVCLYACLPVCMSVCLSVSLYAWPSDCPSIFMFLSVCASYGGYFRPIEGFFFSFSIFSLWVASERRPRTAKQGHHCPFRVRELHSLVTRPRKTAERCSRLDDLRPACLSMTRAWLFLYAECYPQKNRRRK